VIRVQFERLLAMSQQPFISIPLDIPNLRVLQTDLTKAGEFILTVESTLESTTCRHCRRTITEQHGSDQARLLRHLPILGRPVYLCMRPKRFRCPFCDDHPTTTYLSCGRNRDPPRGWIVHRIKRINTRCNALSAFPWSILQVRALWVPLMGTGVADLPAVQSFESILRAIAEWQPPDDEQESSILIVIYKEKELPRNQVLDSLNRVLPSQFVVEPIT